MKRAVAPLSVRKIALVELLMEPARRIVGTEVLLTAAERTSNGIDGGGSSKLGLDAIVDSENGIEGELLNG